MAAAEAALASSPPEDVVAGALRHFQQLFNCPTLEGVVPTVNKVGDALQHAGICTIAQQQVEPEARVEAFFQIVRSLLVATASMLMPFCTAFSLGQS